MAALSSTTLHEEVAEQVNTEAWKLCATQVCQATSATVIRPLLTSSQHMPG
jgi:hypothetical protein